MSSFSSLRKHIAQYVEITDKEFDDISKAFSVSHYQAKSYILKKGQVCNFMAYINHGCLESHIKIGKKEQIVNFPVEGWWIGDLKSMVHNKATTIFLRALEDSELLILEKVHFERLIQSNYNFLLYILMVIHQAYLKANEQYAVALSQSVEERYSDLMNNTPDFINQIPDKHLASYLGVQPPSLSRIKRKKIKKQE